MSEEAKVAPEGKKKGKMPIILALVLVLGGGGFFMMKGKGPKKPEIKAGLVQAMDKEFLINLAGGPNFYLRAEIALELRDGYTKEALDEEMSAIRDCINQIFRSKTMQQVGASNTEALRKEMAAAINKILISHMKPEAKKTQEELEKAFGPHAKNDEKKSEKDDDKEKDKEGDGEKEEWASPTGPVINVYFTSFTTQ